MHRMPYAKRQNFGAWFFSEVIAPLAGYTKRTRENLNWIFPEMSPEKINGLTKLVGRNIGITLSELFSPDDFVKQVTSCTLKGSGLAALKIAYEKGRPVIVVSGHFGNYDVVRANLIAMKLPVGGLYRRMNNPYFDAYYIKSISKIGTPLFERGRRGLKSMLTFMRAGGILAVLTDQSLANGIPMSFMGKRAYTSLSIADLALKLDAVIVPAYAVRQPDLSYEVHIEEPIAHSTAFQMTQEINNSLDRRVRKNPEQWLWIHRRWKSQASQETRSD
tara:strand:- start:1141 stop:1965 length:825 start_codon:yes stop_codon:yes gene_type:complete